MNVLFLYCLTSNYNRLAQIIVKIPFANVHVVGIIGRVGLPIN